MENHKIRVLFLCTGNCYRSQMAEAILRHLGRDRFEAFSAGSRPAGFVHPLAIQTLEEMGIPVGEARSKSWDEFAYYRMDLVITLCDSAAKESCPIWPGAPLRVHWPVADAISAVADETELRELSRQVAARLQEKIRRLIRMDWPNMNQKHRCRRLEQIARL
ncbi:MAG: arsenate reductase ArsC [Phycisphaerales bacterium]|nr:MAG: arsenate reductase ArsC [Phycisphaerales bacterium]